MSPISYKATSVSWLERGLVYCESHCIKLYDNKIVSVISGGNLEGDVDGPASHSLLCQPVGICTEFSRNLYTDSESGSIKLINGPLHGIVEFLSNLQTLLTAFHIHAKGKSLVTTHHTVSEAIEMVNQTLEYVKSCSLKAKKLQHLSEHLVTNGPESTVSSKCFKSLELLKKSLQKMEDNIKELSTHPGLILSLIWKRFLLSTSKINTP